MGLSPMDVTLFPGGLFQNRNALERRFGVGLCAAAAGFFLIVLLGGSGWRDAYAEAGAEVETKLEASGKVFPDEKSRALEVYKKIKVAAIVRTWLWWGALGGGVLSLGLAVTRRLWVGGEIGSPCSRPGSGGGGWFWGVLLAAVTVAFFLRAPRMPLSLYNDEYETFSWYVDGKFKQGEEGELKFRRRGWEETVWGNRRGNNSQLYSVLSRLCHDAWRHVSEAVDGQVNPVAFRAPALFGGLASIIGLGLLGRRLAGAHAGVLAAVLAAVHPWHVRYSTEGRCYGLVFLLVIFITYFLGQALAGMRWRWWLAFAAAQCALMMTYAVSVYFATAVNACAFFCILLGGRPAEITRPQALARLVVANLLSAGLYLSVCAPWIPQMLYALEHSSGFQAKMPDTWWLNQVGYFLFGIPWYDINQETVLDPSVLGGGRRAIVWGWIAFVAALFTMGAYKLWRTGSAGRVVLAAVVLSVPLAGVITEVQGGLLHPWYTLYALPPFFLALSAAVARKKNGGWLSPAAGAAIVTAGAVAVMFPALGVYLRHPKEDMSGVALTMRGALFPSYDPDRVITAGLWSDVRLYDPHIKRLDSPEILKKLEKTARDSGLPLYVTFSRKPLAEAANAGVLSVIREPGRYEQIAFFPSFDEGQFNHEVYRYLRDESLETESSDFP